MYILKSLIYTATHIQEVEHCPQKISNNMESQSVPLTHTPPYMPSVSPPVAAEPWGATIIQPSEVKTESDVMRTVKQPWLTSNTLLQSARHAEASMNPHTHTSGVLCYSVTGTTHAGGGGNYMLLY